MSASQSTNLRNKKFLVASQNQNTKAGMVYQQNGKGGKVATTYGTDLVAADGWVYSQNQNQRQNQNDIIIDGKNGKDTLVNYSNGYVYADGKNGKNTDMIVTAAAGDNYVYSQSQNQNDIIIDGKNGKNTDAILSTGNNYVYSHQNQNQNSKMQIVHSAPRTRVYAAPRQSIVYSAPRTRVYAAPRPSMVYSAPKTRVLTTGTKVQNNGNLVYTNQGQNTNQVTLY